MITIITEMNGKLFNQLLGAMKYIDGSNNYVINRLDIIEVKANGIVIEGVSTNEYGGAYSNNDRQFIPKAELPNFAARKLYCCE